MAGRGTAVRGSDVMEFKKGQIVGLYQSGTKCKEITAISGVALRTVQRIIKRWKDGGEATCSRTRCGRKSILDERDRRSLKRLVKKNRRKSTVELTALYNQGGKTISQRTMRRELQTAGLRSCVAKRKPHVSAINRRKRLQFAKQHATWTVQDWGKVMWSDESRFTLFQHDGRVRVRREPHEAMDPTCLVPTVHSSGGSVMIWGCFCSSGLGSAALCSNKMKSAQYLNILDDQVVPAMDFYFPTGSGVFQDDNAQIHRAKSVTSWFDEHDASFDHMIWPPQSPDLNPMENLWDILEKVLRSHTTLPSSLDQLGELLMELWAQLTPATLLKLTETMPRRMRAVIRAKGGPTKY